jgi:entericidin B
MPAPPENVAEQLGLEAAPATATHYRRNAMIAKTVLLMAALVLGSISLSACNTVQGAGKDVERAGEKVQQEAQEHKKY